MTLDEFKKLSKRDFENGATIDDIHRTLNHHELKSDLLYRMARHIKNSNNINPLEWGIKGIDLLVELKKIDEIAYNKKVKNQNV